MKTVPSLVAASTVGVAAAGLALGTPERSTSARPVSKKRKAGTAVEGQSSAATVSAPRPSTSAIASTEYRASSGATESSLPSGASTNLRAPESIHESIKNSFVRRISNARHGEWSSPPEYQGEDTRESMSSRGSWMRRLSTIQISQTNSPRSSVGPDSPCFSNGSAAPILSNNVGISAPLPPNKLVKRTISQGRATAGTRTRSGTTPPVPTFRRPATSHQRSVTLQQQVKRDVSTAARDQAFPDVGENYVPPELPLSSFQQQKTSDTWRPFFESRPTKLSIERISARLGDSNLPGYQATSKRVIPDDSVRPTLVKPVMITAREDNIHEEDLPFEDPDDEFEGIAEEAIPHHIEPPGSNKRPRRSLSTHFSSPGSWLTRSGSLRVNKRNEDVSSSSRSPGRRHASDPISTIEAQNTSSGHRAVTDPTVFQTTRRTPSPIIINDYNDPFSQNSFHHRTRNNSSPLPPISRLSSFNTDLARLGLSSSSSSAPRSPNLGSAASGRVSPSAASYFASLNDKRASEVLDRGSTLIGSDSEGVTFVIGDDEDIDFHSETVYDSLRTTTTSSVRSHNYLLDPMFDESPPSITGPGKKRLSVHEMIVNGTFEGSRIIEEDEGMPTPVKASRSQSSREDGFSTPVHKAVDVDGLISSSPPNFLLASQDFNGLSLDDGPEEEEDWNKDDENDFGSPLSPPSHPSSSINSQRVTASFRAALADVTHTGSANAVPANDRPRSSLFDWAEPSMEKMDSPRPKTAHVKQMTDGRGGRGLGRRGASALHIRSQSVPVVPDITGQRDNPKNNQKFGTWGLGGKGVSEDWDNDFDFEGVATSDGDTGDMNTDNSIMHVPAAIQASQANVVGHVGQIREVCLLVEDLKRLRALGREKGLLTGSAAALWKEAEGIIALAVPDEDDLALSPAHSPVSGDFEMTMIDASFNISGLDGEDVTMSESPFEVLSGQGKPIGVSRDGSQVRRRSVFMPEDDIFGSVIMVNTPRRQENLRPKPASRATSPRLTTSTTKNSSDVARSVMETMHQHRSTSDPLLPELTTQSANKMPFDTTSLRDLVHRASVISRALSELIRKTDGMTQSPEVTPHRESSPAFTRVFTDPLANPHKHLPRSQSNNSVLSGSMDSSPSRSLGSRMHMMTVV